MGAPSKEWKEEIASDEEVRFNGYAKSIEEIQKKKSAQYGTGRALHRKIICGLKAKLEILGNIPDYAKVGLFAKAQTFDALIRISNGGVDVKPDSVPDIRGFALKVLGQNGPNALGSGNTDSQDFTLINQSAFAFPKSAPFIALVIAASESPFSLIKHLFGTYGVIGGFQRVVKTAKTFGKPFSGFMTETFYSAAPIACGDYAGRVRLLPVSNQKITSSNNSDLSIDIKKRLATEDVEFYLQMQFFVNEKITPIEDASVDWLESESPYITLGKLTIPKQNPDSEEGKALNEKIEKSVFDP
ncbi:MAG TPA: catalase [Leptospiraceae bacterium]|nr:catalase [Leptospiraceae bacterium]